MKSETTADNSRFNSSSRKTVRAWIRKLHIMEINMEQDQYFLLLNLPTEVRVNYGITFHDSYSLIMIIYLEIHFLILSVYYRSSKKYSSISGYLTGKTCDWCANDCTIYAIRHAFVKTRSLFGPTFSCIEETCCQIYMTALAVTLIW